jgi:alkyl sulfatase BDS1-like metallo-beta-lactamase superfamily hydrolase
MTVVHPAQSQETKPAELTVAAANRAVQSQLPFGDRQDFEDAMRGFIATTPDPANPDRWAFLKHEAPPTVNPSLWRQAQINVANGDPPRRKTGIGPIERVRLAGG